MTDISGYVAAVVAKIICDAQMKHPGVDLRSLLIFVSYDVVEYHNALMKIATPMDIPDEIVIIPDDVNDGGVHMRCFRLQALTGALDMIASIGETLPSMNKYQLATYLQERMMLGKNLCVVGECLHGELAAYIGDENAFEIT